jgi:protein-tyrosine phosphatase
MTRDGHHVKWNQIYRSADISKLSDGDLGLLSARKISYVVDLRGTEESKKAPDRLNPNTDYILCPAGSDSSLTNWMQALTKMKSGGDSMMVSYYSKTEFLADRYKPLFAKLVNLPSGEALLYHCTAGKDRTGIGSALLLYALGVPYETIMEDYLASNYYRARENEKMVASMVQYMHINEQVAKDMASVKKEYLDATFTALKTRYGSIEAFLSGPMGLTSAQISILKSKFLE